MYLSHRSLYTDTDYLSLRDLRDGKECLLEESGIPTRYILNEMRCVMLIHNTMRRKWLVGGTSCVNISAAECCQKKWKMEAEIAVGLS